MLWGDKEFLLLWGDEEFLLSLVSSQQKKRSSDSIDGLVTEVFKNDGLHVNNGE